MALNWSRGHIEKLIVLIQQRPCLYKNKSIEYLDWRKKTLALNEVLVEMKKSNISITLEDIKKKWRKLRTRFENELLLIRLSEKSCAGRSDVRVPQLWCFEQLAFLKPHATVRPSKDNIELNEDSSTSDEVGFEEQSPKKFKRAINVMSLRKDLLSIKNRIIERKNKSEKKFAWLGALVVALMEKIHPDKQADAAWQVQCLMRKLTSNS